MDMSIINNVIIKTYRIPFSFSFVSSPVNCVTFIFVKFTNRVCKSHHSSGPHSSFYLLHRILCAHKQRDSLSCTMRRGVYK